MAAKVAKKIGVFAPNCCAAISSPVDVAQSQPTATRLARGCLELRALVACAIFENPCPFSLFKDVTFCVCVVPWSVVVCVVLRWNESSLFWYCKFFSIPRAPSAPDRRTNISRHGWQRFWQANAQFSKKINARCDAVLSARRWAAHRAPVSAGPSSVVWRANYRLARLTQAKNFFFSITTPAVATIDTADCCFTQ